MTGVLKPTRAEGRTTSRATTPMVGSEYRAHLDGLRAVAVYFVVAFHSGVDRAAGGFIGVDVFFVLSGYLVTQLLVRDLEAIGSVDLRRFYGRRVRRLIPAALVTLLVTMVVFSSVASPAELPDARDAVRAAALYVSNWHFIAQSAQYFGADVASSPVLHFWSLSVEEQFYALWPLLLLGLHRLAGRAGPRRWAVVWSIVAIAMAASCVTAVRLAGTDLDRAHFGTDTRAYQLLAGALLALAPIALTRLHRRPAARTLPALATIAVAGLVLLASDVVDANPVVRGVVATGLTVALIVAIEAAPRGQIARALAVPGLAYLGRISYGTYLWHWLVIIVMTRTVDASPASTAAITTLLATGLAAISYELLEHPIRRSPQLDRRRVAVVATGLALSAVVGLVAAPTLLDLDSSTEPPVRQGSATSGSAPVPADLDWRGAQQDLSDFPECTAAAADRCTLVPGAGAHVLLIGDSHARMFIPMLEELARTRNLALSAAVAPVCPWQAGLQYYRRVDECRAHQSEWYPTIVERLDPDVVVLAHRTFDDLSNGVRLLDESIGEIKLGSEEATERIRQRSAAVLGGLTAAGRIALVVEPVPVAPKGTDPLLCLAEAAFLDECRYVAHRAPTPTELVYRELDAADERVWTLDLDRQVCPYLPICDPMVDGLIVKRDETHLTTRFAMTLRGSFEQLLDETGLLKGPAER